MNLNISKEWFERRMALDPDDAECGAGFEICDAPPGFLQALVDLSTQQRRTPMTTTIIVKANHGWPVDVEGFHPKTGEKIEYYGGRVAPNEERTFHIHSTMDLRIHEVQPDEIEKPEPKRAA